MLKYYLSRDLSERLHIPLSRWKRWSREFLPPDPLGGLQSGYARQYSVRDAFAVYWAGFLVSHLGFSIPEARRILNDLDGWLKRNVVSGFEAAADGLEMLPAAPQHVELIIIPVDERPGPARRIHAPDREHVVPVGLREQHRGLDGPRALPGLRPRQERPLGRPGRGDRRQAPRPDRRGRAGARAAAGAQHGAEPRAAGGHAANDGNTAGFGQADTARCPGDNLDGALARQCLEVLLGGVGGLETEFAGDVRPGGRKAGLIDMPANEVQHLLLAVGELFHHDPCFYIQML